MVDRLAKEAAVKDGPAVYDKIPREGIVTWGKGKQTSDVATTMDEYRGRGGDQGFLPVREEQVMTKNSHFPRVYNNGIRSWETKVIPS
jgi:hypothetical protein